MEKILLVLLALTIVFAEIPLTAAPPKANAKPAPAKPAAPPKPNRNQIIAKLRRENPFKQVKVGESVSFPLLGGATVSGKVFRIKDKGVWVDDGVVKVLQRRTTMSYEGRAKFWKEDYEKYINERANEEVRQQTGVNFKGNVNSVAKPDDPRFKRPKMSSGEFGGGKSGKVGFK